MTLINMPGASPLVLPVQLLLYLRLKELNYVSSAQMKCYLPSCTHSFHTHRSIHMWWCDQPLAAPDAVLELLLLFQIPASIAIESVCKMCLLIVVCLQIFGSLLLNSFTSAEAFAKKWKTVREREEREDNIVIQCFNWKHLKHQGFIFWMYS